MLAQELKTIPITWPFTVWGLDMVGPFKTAPGGYTHLLVAVDKFTKWVEAKPIKKLDGATAANFLWGLISRFGCLIASSPIMAPISRKAKSRSIATSMASA